MIELACLASVLVGFISGWGYCYRYYLNKYTDLMEDSREHNDKLKKIMDDDGCI